MCPLEAGLRTIPFQLCSLPDSRDFLGFIEAYPRDIPSLRPSAFLVGCVRALRTEAYHAKHSPGRAFPITAERAAHVALQQRLGL